MYRNKIQWEVNTQTCIHQYTNTPNKLLLLIIIDATCNKNDL